MIDKLDLELEALMRALMVALFVCLFSKQSYAQSLLDDLESAVADRAGELARVDKLLMNPDPNNRIAAMEKLLGSGDPLYVQKAKEVGLFSADVRLRQAAIRSILNEGGSMRAEFDIPAGKSDLTAIYDWLSRLKGSWSEDGKTGYFSFGLGKYNSENDCWSWPGSSACSLRLSGEKVSIANWSGGSYSATATMSLDDTGALTGPFLVNGSGNAVTVSVPLID